MSLKGTLKILYTFVFLTLFNPFQLSFADTLQPISGREISEREILPADVLARANLIRDELELIRLELGKAKAKQNNVTILETAPREVYFAAQALFIKANRLAFEKNKTTEDAPPIVDIAKVKPYHVWQMVNAAYLRIQETKIALNIKQEVTEQLQPKSTLPNDVILSILKSNNTASHILSLKLSPADVYQQITASINITAQLLSQFNDVVLIPEAAQFERRKTPSDVYNRLYQTFKLIKKISTISQVSMLDFTPSQQNHTKTPSDVYDLATLLKAELSYLHASLPNNEEVAKAYFPGNKTPSHVYQRLGVLEQQLTALVQLTAENPNWLQ